MAGGLPSVAKGYMENVAIPTTQNEANRMGLGRSGGALEAVANTAWAPGVDIMKLLMGLPPVKTGQTTTTKKRKGVVDWLGDIFGLAGTGMDIFNAWPKSAPESSGVPSSVGYGDFFGGASGT